MVFVETCGATLCHSASNTADIGNSLFGSIVAVTGDAHQAQVAQDIFRQEVRIERSLRIREDIRDAHKLMIENVQTQLLMGNIVLGICFMVLIEGKPSDPALEPVLVQELWAVFAVWAVSLSFLSVWFALHFQEVVSLSARKRLLEKHRICTPNDEVVGRMGGGNIAEKVSQLHQEGLNRLSGVLAASSVYESVREACHSSVEAKTTEAGDEHVAPSHLMNIKSLALKSPVLPILGSAQSVHSGDGSPRRHRYSDAEIPDLIVKVSFGGPSPTVSKNEERRNSGNFRRQWSLGEPVAVRACRGTRAWFDESLRDLSSQYVVDLPDFLVDGTLIRCNWAMPEPKLRRPVKIAVQGEATLYVSALWSKSDDFLGVQGAPTGWSPEDIPVLQGGSTDFQRVEGFSVLLSGRKFDLPVYRAVLAKPDSSGWCEAKLNWRFRGSFEAPLIILRKGRVLTREEDWPVREFLNELDDIQPLREHSMRYMGYGITNLLCAAFFAHLGRVLTDRPWPQCSRELVIIFCAFLPALVFSFQSEALMRWLFNSKLPRHLRDLAAHATATQEPPTLGSKTLTWESSEAGNDSRDNSPRDNADISQKGKLGSSPKISDARVLSSLRHSNIPASTSASDIIKAVSPVEAEAGVRQDYMCEQQCSGSHLGFPSCLSQSQATVDPQELVIVRDQPEEKELWYSETTSSTASEFVDKSHTDLEIGRERVSPSSVDAKDFCDTDIDKRSYWVWLWEAKLCRRLQSSLYDYPHMCRINFFSMVVQLLWFSSILGLILSRTFPSLQVGGLAQQASKSASLHWAMQEVTWPAPFFAPTAAALAPDGSLWVASDWLLTRLEGEQSAAWRLPMAAKGVLLPPAAFGQHGLVIASDSLLVPLTLPGNGSRVPASGLGSLQLSRALPAAEPSLKLPVDQLGAITAATAGRLPGIAADIVFVALKDGGVAICAPQQLLQNSSTPQASRRLHVAAKVPQVYASVTAPGSSSSGGGGSGGGGANAAPQALFFCADSDGSCGSVSEPVLWVLENTGCLLATGLESGRALGNWRVSLPDGPKSRQQAALAGNATHLVIIAARHQSARAAVLAATFTHLIASASSDCA